MSESTWPTADDVIDELKEVGLTIEPGRTLDRALRTAIEAFEAATHYSPFIASEEATERRIEMPHEPSEYIDMGMGAVKIISVGLGDGLLAVDSLVIPLPQERNQPYTYLHFPHFVRRGWDYFSDNDGALRVTARWGYCDTLPALVETAVIGYAASAIAEKYFRQDESRAVEEVEEAEVKRKWSTSVTERRAVFESWTKQWNFAVNKFRFRGIS